MIKFYFLFFYLIQRKNFFFFLNFYVKHFNKKSLFRDFLFPLEIIFPGLNFSPNRKKLLVFYNLYKNLINNSFFFFMNNSLLEKTKRNYISYIGSYLKLLIFFLELFFFKKKVEKLILKFLFLEFIFFRQSLRAKNFYLRNFALFQFFLNKFKFINFFFKFNKSPLGLIIDKKHNLTVISEEENKLATKQVKDVSKKWKFKSYLYKLDFPGSLYFDFSFSTAFKKLLKEHELALRKKKLEKEKKSSNLKISKNINIMRKNTYLLKNQKTDSNQKKKMSTFVKKPKKNNFKKDKFYDFQIFYFFSKLVNLNTKNGLKKKSLRFFLDCFCVAKKELKLQLSNKDILTKIFFSLDPIFILKKFNLGRRAIIIPFPITKDKKVKITSQIFLAGIKKRSENTFRQKVIEEIKDFYKKKKIPMSIKLRNERIKIAIESKNNIRFLRFFK